MIYILEGQDNYIKQQEYGKIYKKYGIDNSMTTSFSEEIEISEFVSAIQSVSMFDDYNVVVAKLLKKQFLRLKEYFGSCSKYTILIIDLQDFVLNSDYRENLPQVTEVDCRPLKQKEFNSWVRKQAVSYGFSLEQDDARLVTSLCRNCLEADKLLYQLSFLPAFNRPLFLKEQFTSRQKFSWELLVALFIKNKKKFFSELAEQKRQNLGLDERQFYLKIIGSLVYAIKNIQTAPIWYQEQIIGINEDLRASRHIKIFLLLIETAALARKDNNSINVNKKFIEYFNVKQ